MTHVRIGLTVNGIRVQGTQWIVHLEPDGSHKSTQDPIFDRAKLARLSTRPLLSEDRARRKAAKAHGQKGGSPRSARLAILAERERFIRPSARHKKPERLNAADMDHRIKSYKLVYDVVIGSWLYVIDARNGELHREIKQIKFVY